MAYDRSAACRKMAIERWKNDKPEDRFWKSVNKNGPNGCWIWDGARTKEDYGTFVVNGRRMVVSRYAYALLVGKIPEGHLVCHHCDNPPCCNPAHLFAGTSQDNVSDCISKGRTNPVKGIESPMAKLSESEVLEIISLKRSGLTQSDIATRFGLNQSSVSRLFNKKRWKHLT